MSIDSSTRLLEKHLQVDQLKLHYCNNSQLINSSLLNQISV